MKSRQTAHPADQASWSWVESITDPANVNMAMVRSAYRLNLPSHSLVDSKCKKNCRTNPRCYVGLGETRWLDVSKKKASGNDPEADEEAVLNVTSEQRLNRMPSGLINLGNTCYINSFLQIWFHNVWLRYAIYRWKEDEVSQSLENSSLEGNLNLGAKIKSLQLLFALMEFSCRKALDPNDFISKLAIDPQIQQDAQEFSKLFLHNLLQKGLSTQSNLFVRDIVQRQFRGEYNHSTTCTVCRTESKSKEDSFDELVLSLKGNKTLLECIDEYFAVELLDGDNQYNCGTCGTKRDAERRVRLRTLPPVLNLSLNRFIFDLKTGKRKKLMSPVTFPLELDMTKYMSDPDDKKVYSLTGVLIHIGENAHHGHYKAHIKDLTSGQWFQFSDDVVESLSGMESCLGTEVDLEISKSSTKPNALAVSEAGSSNGRTKSFKAKSFVSKSAYMFVYTDNKALNDLPTEYRPENVSRIEPTDFPPVPNWFPKYLQDYIERDRSSMYEEIDKFHADQENASREREETLAHMRQVCSKLAFPDGSDDFEFIPTGWLKSYMASPQAHDKIDLTDSLCCHGKLCLDKLSGFKAINQETARLLYDRIGSRDPQLRFDAASLCSMCVTNQFKYMQLSKSLNIDGKTVTDLLKDPVDPSGSTNDNFFWVSKACLKRWRTMAREELDEQVKSETERFVDDHESSPDVDMKPEVIQKTPKKKKESSKKMGGSAASPSLKDSKNDSPNNSTGIIITDEWQSVVIPNETKETAVTVNMKNGKSAGPVDDDDDDGIDGEEDQPDGDDGLEGNGHAAVNRVHFDSDLLCHHGNLCVDQSGRRLVPEKVWLILKKYFNSCQEFKSDRPACHLCEAYLGYAKEETKMRQELAFLQKTDLSDILLDKRPSFYDAKLNRFHIISKSFVDAWRSWVRHPSASEPITNLSVESLLCPHGNLSYSLSRELPKFEDPDRKEDSELYIVTEDQWKSLLSHFATPSVIISLIRTNGVQQVESNGHHEDIRFTSSPPECDSCIQQRHQEELEEMLNYKSASIFVREKTDSDKSQKEDPTDPDFTAKDALLPPPPPAGQNGGPPTPKRFKMSSSPLSSPTTSANGGSGDTVFVRRSNRRLRVRGEKELLVDSTMKLMELKIKLMPLFRHTPPMDQHLFLDGKELVGPEKTLKELRVFPESTLILTIDEPKGRDAQDDPAHLEPETGFKGTGLVSGL